MVTTAGILLAAILFALSLLHFYWAAGGRWGFNEALPQDHVGRRVLNPGKTSCIIVGAGLLAFASYYLIRTNVLPVGLPEWLLTYGAWGVSVLFGLRAIGDFRYVGFTKKITGTDFAARDTKYYSPLCTLLSLGGIMISLLS
jgi:hypothetical protein